MSEAIVRILILAAVLAIFAFIAKRMQKGKSEKRSANGAFKVKDKISLSFQTELIAIEHDGSEILLIGSQGDYRQVFKEVPDFKKMVGG